MLQNYKKSKEGQKGFTIVELLIVIVVIAILAAITIVAYNGVTTSARSSKAVQNAQNVQSVAEAYNAENGRYPGTITELSTGGVAAKIPSGMTVLRGPAAPTGATAGVSAWTGGTFSGLTPIALTATNGETNVTYSIAGSAGASTGGVIAYWNFGAASALNFIYVGSATGSTVLTQPAA